MTTDDGVTSKSTLVNLRLLSGPDLQASQQMSKVQTVARMWPVFQPITILKRLLKVYNSFVSVLIGWKWDTTFGSQLQSISQFVHRVSICQWQIVTNYAISLSQTKGPPTLTACLVVSTNTALWLVELLTFCAKSLTKISRAVTGNFCRSGVYCHKFVCLVL